MLLHSKKRSKQSYSRSKVSSDAQEFYIIEREAEKALQEELNETIPQGLTLSGVGEHLISKAIKGKVTDELGREIATITREQAMEIKALARYQFEEIVRGATHKGLWVLGKLLELGNGVSIQGEKGVYSVPPNFRALELLMRYGFGQPTGEEKVFADTSSVDGRTQINIFIPENNRQQEFKTSPPLAIETKFKE